jgi:GNAT superfamily N-acetyltransferase
MVSVRSVNGYEVSTDQDRLDVDLVFRFLSEESYWSPGVPRAVVERSIENSMCFGVYRGEDQVGFARIVTDKATFALVADVFILEPHRGKGLSKLLMREVMEHPDLTGLRALALCPIWLRRDRQRMAFHGSPRPRRVRSYLKRHFFS